MHRHLPILVVVIALSALAGCATTQPWEREYLARPEMSPDGDHRAALFGHYLAVREGAIGATGHGGGGCGCN